MPPREFTLAQALQGFGEVAVRTGETGLYLDRLPVGGRGFFEQALLLIRSTEGVVQLRVLRRELKPSSLRSRGLGQLPARLMCCSQVEVGSREERISIYGRLEFRNGLLHPPLPEVDHPQVPVGLGEAREQLGGQFIGLNRLVESI